MVAGTCLLLCTKRGDPAARGCQILPHSDVFRPHGARARTVRCGASAPIVRTNMKWSIWCVRVHVARRRRPSLCCCAGVVRTAGGRPRRRRSGGAAASSSVTKVLGSNSRLARRRVHEGIRPRAPPLTRRCAGRCKRQMLLDERLLDALERSRQDRAHDRVGDRSLDGRPEDVVALPPSDAVVRARLLPLERTEQAAGRKANLRHRGKRCM